MTERATLRQPSRRGPERWKAALTWEGSALVGLSVILALDALSFPSLGKQWLACVVLAIVVTEVVSLIRRTTRLDVLEVGAQRTRAGEPANLYLMVHNRHGQDQLISARIFHSGQPTTWCWIGAGKRQSVSPVVSGQVLDRGEHDFPDLVVRVHSLLRMGFVQRRVVTPRNAATVVVWPAQWHGFMPTPTRVAEASPGQPSAHPAQVAEEQGDHPSSHLSPGSHGWLRKWREGDRLAHIAHKASAHRGMVLVQTLANDMQEPEQDVWLSLDWAMETMRGDTEAALRLLGALVEQAHERRQRFGLDLDGQRVEAGSGNEHRKQALDTLARWARVTP